MKVFKRYLILTHRYAGIPLSLIFITWFLSGIVMIYTGGMPALSQAELLSRQSDLDLSLVQLTPVQAMAVMGRNSGDLPVLRMLHDRPLYQFTDDAVVGVFADSGEILRRGGISSRRLVAEFLNVDEDLVVREAVLEESDQWTLGLQQYLPIQKFRVADGNGSQVYVSASRARVILHTTSTERLLAWAGAIPHWFYLEALRESPRAWTTVVVWTATLASLFVIPGLILLITQWRKTQPFSLSRAIPYQGLHRWHYILGGVFGVFTLTWAFSGLLSMEPYAWTNERGYQVDVDAVDPPALSAFNRIDSFANILQDQSAESGKLKLLRFVTVLGESYFEQVSVANGEYGRPVLAERSRRAAGLIEANAQPGAQAMKDHFSELLALAGDGVEIKRWEVLGKYDSYYYPRNSYSASSPKLPVIRVELNDQKNTWYYLDAGTGRVLYQNHQNSRRERWLYNGLHSLDFPFWYERRPLWDVAMILLLLGGAALSGIGGFLGIRRLLRN